MPDNRGVFDWKQRMGVHWAYHQNVTNRVVHFICIPFILLGIIKLISLLPEIADYEVTYLIILLMAPIFLLPELLSGICLIVLLAILSIIAAMLPAGLIGGIIGLSSLIIPFIIQTQVGHKCFEIEGRDDTERNIKEFLQTKNPIPLLLIFYYHMVELLLLLGYRPKLKEEILFHMNNQTTRFQTIKTKPKSGTHNE